MYIIIYFSFLHYNYHYYYYYIFLGSIALPGSYFGVSNANQSMHITQLSCIGHEYQLWQCTLSATAQCTSQLDASLRCLPRGKLYYYYPSNYIHTHASVHMYTCITTGA